MDGKACLTAEARGGIKESLPERPLPARVLIVEDELAASKLLSAILAQNNCRCAIANNGGEAFAALGREEFDAIISDLRMPGMDGLELLAAIRRRHPHIAFLVTTGVDDLQMGLRAMKSGADDYLVKPLLEETVVASLERALHRQSLDLQIENYRLRLEEMVAERTEQLQKALQQIERSYEDTLHALAQPSTFATPRLQATAGESATTHSRLPRQWGWPISSSTGLQEEPTCTTSVSWESPTPFFSSQALSLSMSEH